MPRKHKKFKEKWTSRTLWKILCTHKRKSKKNTKLYLYFAVMSSAFHRGLHCPRRRALLCRKRFRSNVADFDNYVGNSALNYSRAHFVRLAAQLCRSPTDGLDRPELALSRPMNLSSRLSHQHKIKQLTNQIEKKLDQTFSKRRQCVSTAKRFLIPPKTNNTNSSPKPQKFLAGFASQDFAVCKERDGYPPSSLQLAQKVFSRSR